MAETKLDRNNLPNLKIKVNSTEQSERVQRAFFELGYSWGNITPVNPAYFLFADIDKFLDYSFSESVYDAEWTKELYTEITLPELETLAFGEQKETINNIREVVNGFQGDADDWNREVERSRQLAADPTIDTVGNCGNCGVEFHIHKEPEENQAQKRYDAAVKWCGEQTGFPRFDIMWYHPDTVRQALRIAAGLE